MSHSVYKYPLIVNDIVEIQLPIGAKILKIDAQGEDVCLWAMINKKETKTNLRLIRIAGTGHPIDNEDNLHYINTFTILSGRLWFHAFEVIKE